SYFARGEKVGAEGNGRAGIRMIESVGYLDFLCLMRNASLVVTDSGGIQEETTCLGVPCVTVRDNTERPITLTAGTNVLGGRKCESIRAAIRQQRESTHRRCFPEFWDGKAGARIVAILLQQWASLGA